jgi:regulatory protein
MAVERPRNRKHRPSLDPSSLEQLALRYVGRYATTRAKLAGYLGRKVRERGWSGAVAPDVEALAAKMAGLGYVDDRGFAGARAASLGRRGYGERRVRDALRAAGIGDEDSADAREQARRGGWEAALRLAQRRGIGPYAAEDPGRDGRDRAFAILLRAGHPPDLARRVAQARPGEIPDADGS